MSTNVRAIQPQWEFRLIGALSPQDPAVIQSPVSWATLLGFPKDPTQHSSNYREALHKLETMDLEQARKPCLVKNVSVKWTIYDTAAVIDGKQVYNETNSTFNPFSTVMNKMFDVTVPFIFQLRASKNTVSLVKRFQQPPPLQKSRRSASSIRVRHLYFHLPGISELVWILTQTVIKQLDLTIDVRKAKAADIYQAVVNSGHFFTTFLCDSSLWNSTIGVQHSVVRENDGHIRLKCGTEPHEVFVAMCSAISEVAVVQKVKIVVFSRLQATMQDPLSWMIYALYCGSSTTCTCIQEVKIDHVDLTQSVLASAKAVMKSRYPLPISEDDLSVQPRYGFVDLVEGADLFITLTTSGNDITIVNPRSCRCRALYDESKSPDWVDVVVPGYGVCTTKLQDGVVEFSPDTFTRPYSYQKQLEGNCIQSLRLDFERVETGSLVTDLMTLIGRRLTKLSISCESMTGPDDLDLSNLAMACPVLNECEIDFGFNVFISARNDPLHEWPIQEIRMCWSTVTSALEKCLTDSTFRMARELVVLRICFPLNGPKNPMAEKMKLLSHNDEFLPVVKVKFPRESKAALISAVKAKDDLNWQFETDSSLGRARSQSCFYVRLDACATFSYYLLSFEATSGCSSSR